MLLSTYYGEKERELKDANRGKVAAARILDIGRLSSKIADTFDRCTATAIVILLPSKAKQMPRPKKTNSAVGVDGVYQSAWRVPEKPYRKWLVSVE